MAKAISLLDDARLDALLYPKLTFENLPTAIDKVFDAKANILCATVEYEQ